jgi:hypothetical protein
MSVSKIALTKQDRYCRANLVRGKSARRGERGDALETKHSTAKARLNLEHLILLHFNNSD